MKIKDVIAATGIPEKTIRYYESCGLVQPATERRNGRTYHEFSEKDVETLGCIVTLRKANFTIDEIRTMQAKPKEIPTITKALRERVRAAVQNQETILNLPELAASPDWKTLSSRIEAAHGGDSGYISPLRFGQLDEESQAEKDAAIAAYQKRHSRNYWRIATAILAILCLLFAGCTVSMMWQDAKTVPAANGSTEGWVYYGDGGTLCRMGEAGTEAEVLYSGTMADVVSNVLITGDKVYFVETVLVSEGETNEIIYRLDPETMEFQEMARIEGTGIEYYEDYCYCFIDLKDGMLESWAILNLTTGEMVKFPNTAGERFVSFTEKGFFTENTITGVQTLRPYG